MTEFNGPLMFIPGSHKKGVVDARHDTTTTSYPLWTVDHALIAEMIDKAGGKGRFDEHGRHVGGGIVSPHGPAGSMILFHGCLAARLRLQPLAVQPRQRLPEPQRGRRTTSAACKRPEYIAHRDFTPIETLPDDCLLRDYPIALPWKAGMPASALETSTGELKVAA